MGLGLLNKAKNVLGQSESSARFVAANWDAYSPTTFLTADFISSDKTITAGNESLIGEHIIPPQTEQGFGYGTPALPYNQGVIYMDLKDSASTPVSVDGVIRLVVSDYRGEETREVFRGNLSTLKQGATDITKRVKFPFTNKTGKQNDRLRIYFTPKTVGNGTVSSANSILEIAGSLKSSR